MYWKRYLVHFITLIADVKQEDSGNYTCEIRGPHAILLGHVSYILHIRGIRTLRTRLLYIIFLIISR
jgi:hypothetical protein